MSCKQCFGSRLRPPHEQEAKNLHALCDSGLNGARWQQQVTNVRRLFHREEKREYELEKEHSVCVAGMLDAAGSRRLTCFRRDILFSMKTDHTFCQLEWFSHTF